MREPDCERRAGSIGGATGPTNKGVTALLDWTILSQQLMKHSLYFLLFAAMSLAAGCATNKSVHSVSLFDGKTLDGWTQKGGKAKYRVEDGQIVGATVPNTPNSFLCTTRDFANFVLELDFKVDDGLNSGVQVRSHCFGEPTTVDSNGKAIKVPAGRVHGYQV